MAEPEGSDGFVPGTAAAAGPGESAPPSSARARPVPLQVKAVISVCALKSAMETIKLPFVMHSVLLSLPGAAVFKASVASCSLAGPWILTRMERYASPRVTTWIAHLCGLLSNSWAVVFPESLFPILPGSCVRSASMASALLQGCMEQLQAVGEEEERWGGLLATCSGTAAFAALFLAPLIAPSFYTVIVLCFAVDLLLTPFFFICAVPVHRPKPSSSPTWPELWQTESLRTPTSLWMLTWHFVRALEHETCDLLLLVAIWARLRLSTFHVTLFIVLAHVGGTLSVYSDRQIRAACRTYPRLWMLGIWLYMVLIRLAACQLETIPVMLLVGFLAGAGTVVTATTQGALWSEFVALKDEVREISSVQASVQSLVLVLGPLLAGTLGTSLEPLTILNVWVLSSSFVIVYGQLGLNLIMWNAPLKSKEE